MSRLLLSLLTCILTVWLLGGSCWYAQNYGTESAGVLAANKVLPAFHQYDETIDNGLNLPDFTNFQFKKSSEDVIFDYDTRQGLKSFANYLNEHNNIVTLTGHYSPFEKNDSRHYNLGLARALQIKEILVEYNVPSQHIIVQSFENDHLQFPDGFLLDGVEFSLEELSAPASTPASKKMSIDNPTLIIRPLNLYYNRNEDIVMNTPELKAYLADLKKALKYNPNAIVKIIGHTDDVGSPESNMILSKKRANSVKSLMVNSGIPQRLIVVDNKGATQPLVSNETPTGQKKNRRVEVRIGY